MAKMWLENRIARISFFISGGSFVIEGSDVFMGCLGADRTRADVCCWIGALISGIELTLVFAVGAWFVVAALDAV